MAPKGQEALPLESAAALPATFRETGTLLGCRASQALPRWARRGAGAPAAFPQWLRGRACRPCSHGAAGSDLDPGPFFSPGNVFAWDRQVPFSTTTQLYSHSTGCCLLLSVSLLVTGWLRPCCRRSPAECRLQLFAIGSSWRPFGVGGDRFWGQNPGFGFVQPRPQRRATRTSSAPGSNRRHHRPDPTGCPGRRFDGDAI